MTNVNTQMFVDDKNCGNYNGLKATAATWKKFFAQLNDDDIISIVGDFDGQDVIIVNGQWVFACK